MEIVEIAAIATAAATVIGVAAAIFLRQRSHRASSGSVVAPDNKGTIESRRDTAISGHAIGADRGGRVTQNIGLPGEDHDRLARIEGKLDEFIGKASDPSAANLQIADLAAETTAKAERMLDEALEFLDDSRYKDAIEHVLSAYDRDLPPEARAELHLVAGNAFFRLTEYDSAAAHYREALRAAPGLRTKAAAISGIGLVHTFLDELSEAEERYNEAVSIQERIGDRDGLATTFANLGIVCSKRGDLEDAEEYLRKALSMAEEFGDRSRQASVLGNLGLVYAGRGDLERAEEYHREALDIHEETDYRLGQASQLANLGSVYAERGDMDVAEEHYRPALAIAEEIGASVIVGQIQDLLEELKATDD